MKFVRSPGRDNIPDSYAATQQLGQKSRQAEYNSNTRATTSAQSLSHRKAYLKQCIPLFAIITNITEANLIFERLGERYFTDSLVASSELGRVAV